MVKWFDLNGDADADTKLTTDTTSRLFLTINPSHNKQLKQHQK